MAQDPPRTYDQGYPQHGTGQQPDVGHDHQQQTWYQPQPEQPADPWGAAGQQQAYQAGADQQAWQQQPLQQAAWDGTQNTQAYPQGYYATGYEQQQPQADPYAGAGQYADPYAAYGTATTADPYAAGIPEQPHYAPAGTDAGYGAHTPYQQETGLPVGFPETGFPEAGFTETGLPETDPYRAAFPQAADGPAATATLSPYTVTSDWDDAEDGTGRAPAGKPSLADRAKAAATAVVSADHGPGRRTLLIRAGAGAAALAVLVTAGILATGGDDGDSSAGGEDTAAARAYTVAHAKAWTAEPAQTAPIDDSLGGAWITADAVVRADGSGVQAYALADGKPSWTVAAPSQGAAPCGLSPTVNTAGIGGVLFRTGSDPKSPCTVLAAVDTKTGKTVWTKNLSDTKDGYDAKVSVLADKVIAVGEDKVFAWASADGKDLWQYTGQGKFCSLSGGATGATVVLHSSCADSTPVDQAVALNAADGKVTWWRGLNNKPKTVTVLSAEPAVFATTGEKPTDDRIFAWGPKGDPAAEFPVTGDAGRLDTARGTFDVAPTVFFHENTLVTTVGPADGGIATAVTAYDLATGKPTWTTAIAEKRKSRAVGLDGGGLLLAVDERLDKPAHISRFAVAGGAETEGGAFPLGTGSLLGSGRVLSGAGKVVVLPEHSANFGTATAFQAKG
ncbi:PQQ-binding-like beta-propeller repeat protein [Kitasatospora sp. NPDC051914]|uniref:outer membrane protein assembly factor BamB family protein n=1 Tax=Kitasatospora sp. NPDC051914 TaxID=3154945 RepID=UPI00341461D2